LGKRGKAKTRALMQNKTPSVTPQHVKAFYILGVQR